MPLLKLQTLELQFRKIEAQVDRQRQIAFASGEEGKPTETAASLLKGFEALLALYGEDRPRLKRALSDEARDELRQIISRRFHYSFGKGATL